MVRMLSVLLGALFLSQVAWATHNRAGEIVYRRINENPFLYEISIITYTKTGGASDAADRCELELFFGDGTSETVTRVNGPVGSPCDPGVGRGVMIAPETRYNVYTTTHEFPGAGTYVLSMEDPMRNGQVVNIPDSDNVPFYIESTLVIDFATGGNNAPILRNPPIDNACVGIPFYHNPGAVDIEGDSLSYSIVASRSYNGGAISGYVFPDQIVQGSNNNLSIDPVSGTLTWDSPQQQGEYNVAILIEEYRINPNSGQAFLVGSIMRDMQIFVGFCMNENTPPVITLEEEVCVTAGRTLAERITTEDIDDDILTVSAVGSPLDNGNGAFIIEGDTITAQAPVEMNLRWTPGCGFVRSAPYWIYFKAKENFSSTLMVELVDFKTMAISVKAPEVTITSIQPEGTALRVRWTPAVCEEATGYDIYRYNDSLGYEPSECVTGVPSQLGYVKIGEVSGRMSTEFLDDDDGLGLVHGQRYCYMIVTTFEDGSESYPSDESCGLLVRDVPILNKVSVVSTDSINGVNSVAWLSPIDLKTSVFPLPYRYRLSRSTSVTGSFEEIFLSDASQDPFSLDTIFVDEGLNTLGEQYYYRIEMLSGPSSTPVGVAKAASSIYLSSISADNQLTLTWDVDVPWKNDAYVVYRFKNDPDSLNDLIVLDTVEGTSYVDDRLANLQKYRYLVRSIGEYTDVNIKGVIENLSQIHTGMPEDVNPPCSPPNQYINGDCNLEQTIITWSDPNENCEDTDDVIGFKVYYAPALGQTLQEIAYIDDPTVTEYVHEGTGSIAGCYALVAVDSFANESAWENSLCVDNCPEYELPNVFTPSGDGRNDLFEPFPYKFVESVDIQIFNRWGVLMYETNNPDVLWDGTDMRSGKPVPEGVYFYVCQVNEIRLTGIVGRELRGSVHLLRENRIEQLAP